MTESKVWHKFLVEADISLLPKEESGRLKGITSGYRPNHNFFGPDNKEMRMGIITVDGDTWIEPGETKKAIVEFIFPDGYVIELKPGLTWRIQEGSQHVGNGTVLYVIE